MKLSFGGGGTTPRVCCLIDLILSKYGGNLIGKLPRQGLTEGSEFGGTYDNFYMAMWDSKGLMFK